MISDAAPRRPRGIWGMLALVSLVGLIFSLLAWNYRSSTKLQQGFLDQLTHIASQQAGAVDYYLAERNAELSALGRSREVSAFFENRALGMSMEYGLQLSLESIRTTFQELLTRSSQAGQPVYRRLVLLDARGQVLVQVSSVSNRPPEAAVHPEWINPAHTRPVLALDGPGQNLRLSLAYTFKGARAGQLLAWLNPELVLPASQSPADHSSVFAGLLFETGELFSHSTNAPGLAGALRALPLLPGRPVPFTAPGPQGPLQCVLVCSPLGKCVPLAHLSAFDITQATAALSPTWLVSTLGVLSLAVLAGAFFIYRQETRALLLRTRLDLSQLRQREVEEKNTQLERLIEERRKAEEARAESQQNLQTLFDNLQEFVVIVDGAGRLIKWNPALESKLGYSASELAGKPVLELHPPDLRLAAGKILRAMAEGLTDTCTLPLATKTGVLIPVETKVTTGRWGSQPVQFGISRDITSRLLFEETLKRAKEEADLANRAKSMFLANMSHEIRTPMNAILGFSQLLLRDPHLTPPQRRHLEVIGQSGEHLLALLDDVLEFSKIEAGRSVLSLAPFDLVQLVGALDALFRLRAEGKGIRLEIFYTGPSPFQAVSDEGKLRQVLINLLGNAVKFTDQGAVELRLEVLHPASPEPRLRVRVADTGPGIAGEDIPRLFQPFEQAASGLKAGGTGLGLAICRKFVTLLGGQISVRSLPGQGALFEFEIPLQPGPQEPLPPKSVYRDVLRLQPGQDPFRVLVVDDKPENRTLLTEILTSAGFEVREAQEGSQALDLYDSWRPQLILMDLRMPGMDGPTAITRLRSRPDGRLVKIIAVTASAFLDNRLAALQGGADDFIGKPFQQAELFAKIALHTGARFDYLPAAPAEPFKASAILTPGALSCLPAPLREAMRAAVHTGDMAALNEQIAAAALHDPALAKSLAGLAGQYEYDQLTRLLDPAGAPPG